MILNPTQRRIFDSLLSIGVDRPSIEPLEILEIREYLENSLREILYNWKSSDIWLTKYTLTTLNKCEGLIQAQALIKPGDKVNYTKQTAIGSISHLGIQLQFTHKSIPIDTYVKSAIEHLNSADPNFRVFWMDADIVTQSEIIANSTSKITNFIDAFPPLDPSWTPRFEEGYVVKIGKLRLSARPDLTLGRPKADGKQTMFLIDFKTGSLTPEHIIEANYYALVLALKNNVAPFRSLVFSLSENEFTDPNVTIITLKETADLLIDSTKKYVEIFTESRPALLNPGSHCTWCPVKETCELSITRN